MFKKTQRLTRCDFVLAFKTASQKKHHALLSLSFTPATSLKVAVVVGKKVATKAVDRNRLRRQLYSQLRQLYDAGTLPIGHYILLTKPTVLRVSAEERQRALEQLLAQLPKTR